MLSAILNLRYPPALLLVPDMDRIQGKSGYSSRRIFLHSLLLLLAGDGAVKHKHYTS